MFFTREEFILMMINTITKKLIKTPIILVHIVKDTPQRSAHHQRQGPHIIISAHH